MTEDEARAEAKRRNDAETDADFVHIAACKNGVWRVLRWERKSIHIYRGRAQ